MKVYKTVTGLQRHLNELRQNGAQIGFVPTMGALHDGHLSLVKRCLNENDIYSNHSAFHHYTMHPITYC
jgi:pantoate--beta-alanine ligase